MDKIEGKTLVFTDLHLGLAGNKLTKLKIAVQAVKEVIKYAKANDIKAILFLGDWNHSRVSTENNVLNVSYKLMSALSRSCPVYMVVGNHDIYMKNSVDVNSLVVFKDLPNVKIITSATPLSINGNKSLLVPWLADVSSEPKASYDMLFGHFDVSSKYLVQSYVQDHSQAPAASSNVANAIDSDSSLGSSRSQSVNDQVGDFVETAKVGGTVFSGHIHTRKEFTAKGRKFIFAGSPYQQNLGEMGNRCGFYVISQDNGVSFQEITSVPKHVELKMSEVTKDIDHYDFSQVKGNILHKVYDIEVDRLVDSKIDQKIQDCKPYEELLPEYAVGVTDTGVQTPEAAKSIELLKKSKLEYISNYIQNIDQKALDADGLDKGQLFKTLENYYNAVTA